MASGKWTKAMREAQAARMRARWQTKGTKLGRPRRKSMREATAGLSIIIPAADREIADMQTVLRIMERLSPAARAFVKSRLE